MRTCASTGLLSSGTVVVFLSDESDVFDPGVYRILGQGSRGSRRSTPTVGWCCRSWNRTKLDG
ncbi:MAG: hypothetical protein M3Q27_06575 [Actinomycetota bacterium]|nr:hypothetical protein [Actinomycetota bacterium]